MSATHAKLRTSIQGISLSLSLVLAVTNLSGFSQSGKTGVSAQEVTPGQVRLLSRLQGLHARAEQIDRPLARALANAEIASAALGLDRDFAEGLLHEAYELTLPSEDERAKMRRIPIGAQPHIPNSASRARESVRQRILQVASHDNGLADELAKLGASQLGTYEGHMEYASLAEEALTRRDDEAASRYILEAIDSDPTQVAAVSAIEQLATRDRAAADRIILQYIRQLSATSLSFADGSVARSTFALARLLLTFTNISGTQGAPPGPEVMKAYVAFVLNSRALLEQQYPGSITAARLLLLHIYPLLKQYAPELVPQFLDLEQRSRKHGEDFSLPTAKNMEDDTRDAYEKRREKAVESDRPDDLMIRSVISHGDFAKARKMIDKLADGPQKNQLVEMVNAQQAISLANKGDISGARELARKLSKATSILRVFPVIAGKCVTKKDEACAQDSVYEAMKKLKQADITSDAPPPGIPASIIGTRREFDPVLASLGSLASAVVSVKDELAFDVLDELVIAANHSGLDTGQGRTGFETSLFKKLAEKDEARANLAAMQLQDPLRQIVALAAIDQWKSDKLVAGGKRVSPGNGSSVKKN
jgi:hypothetical protein